MATELSTTRWEEAHKGKPTGSHFWRFSVSTPEKVWTMETDGPFRRACGNALRSAAKAFGNGANVVVHLLP